MTQQEACSVYIKLLKQYEELTPVEVALARESFNEGWLQHELNNIPVNPDQTPQG